jgi:hypothetical protein
MRRYARNGSGLLSHLEHVVQFPLPTGQNRSGGGIRPEGIEPCGWRPGQSFVSLEASIVGELSQSSSQPGVILALGLESLGLVMLVAQARNPGSRFWQDDSPGLPNGGRQGNIVKSRSLGLCNDMMTFTSAAPPSSIRRQTQQGNRVIRDAQCHAICVET